MRRSPGPKARRSRGVGASSWSHWRGRDVIAQYEAALTAAGAHAGLVDLASFNLVNLLLAGGDERLDCAARAPGTRLRDA